MRIFYDFILKKIKKQLNKKGYYNEEYYQKKFKNFFKNQIYLILSAFAENKKNLNLIQVGANDGVTGDPIHLFIKENKNKVRAVFFEPQSKAFKKLIKNYKDYKNFYFINKAVGIEGKRMFYSVSKSFSKKHNVDFNGISSLKRENVISRIKNYEDCNINKHLVKKKIIVVSLIKELKKILKDKSSSFLKNAALLQIDAEGLDAEIIYSINLKVLKPFLINYEHKNLSIEDRNKLDRYLKINNYRTFAWSNSDTLAIEVHKNKSKQH